jgi:organic hydroperoxide reductase OsmC/OhrA
LSAADTAKLILAEEDRMPELANVTARTALFPHRYSVAAVATREGGVALESERLPALASAPPVEFGGPGDQWSPETLLVASVADCFVLTFRAIARASKLPWSALRCEVQGVLDRVERVTQFTEFVTRVSLRVPPGTNRPQAERLLQRAEDTCLIVNSLKGTRRFESTIEFGDEIDDGRTG